MDLHEDQENNLVTATFELLGLTKENIQINIKDSVLNVSGEPTISSERDEKGYSVNEHRFGKFLRSLPLAPSGHQGMSSALSVMLPERSGPLTRTHMFCSPRRSTWRLCLMVS